ncbi:MAG: hypothetical protein HY922_03230 [Elusimicrobia bacterium]|nr:hypothetical protein [Elusimicrobiota bacterium]
MLKSPYARAYGETLFRPTEPQQDMFESAAALLPAAKRAACAEKLIGDWTIGSIPIESRGVSRARSQRALRS